MSDGPLIEIKLTGKLGQVNPARPDVHSEQRRHDTETGRRLAQVYAEEMLLGMVHDARTDPDPNVRYKARKYVIDRAWGSPKPLTEEEKQGADAGTILDILASVSKNMTAIEQEAANPKVIESDAAEKAYYDVDAILIEAEQERQP